jgi:hypothetical protein
VTVTIHCGGTDLLTGTEVHSGATVELPPRGVLVLAEDQ